MPVIYRVKNLDDAPVKFFALKGEAAKARTEHKKATGAVADPLEMLRVGGREELVALLNNPSGAEPDASDEFL
jgi:hypothetical protein